MSVISPLCNILNEFAKGGSDCNGNTRHVKISTSFGDCFCIPQTQQRQNQAENDYDEDNNCYDNTMEEVSSFNSNTQWINFDFGNENVMVKEILIQSDMNNADVANDYFVLMLCGSSDGNSWNNLEQFVVSDEESNKPVRIACTQNEPFRFIRVEFHKFTQKNSYKNFLTNTSKLELFGYLM